MNPLDPELLRRINEASALAKQFDPLPLGMREELERLDAIQSFGTSASVEAHLEMLSSVRYITDPTSLQWSDDLIGVVGPLSSLAGDGWRNTLASIDTRATLQGVWSTSSAFESMAAAGLIDDTFMERAADLSANLARHLAWLSPELKEDIERERQSRQAPPLPPMPKRRSTLTEEDAEQVRDIAREIIKLAQSLEELVQEARGKDGVKQLGKALTEADAANDPKRD